jgi:hypothetical protein
MLTGTDDWFVELAFLVAVFVSCGFIGFVVGINVGDHYQRQVANGVMRRLTDMLQETHKTLEAIREHERRARAANPTSPASGFHIRPGPSNNPDGPA